MDQLNGDTAPGVDSEVVLGGVLGDMLAALAAGVEPDLDAHVARHPHLAPRIAATWELAREIAVDRPRAPRLVPGYVIERELGRGTMGVVYLARQRNLDRLVALKVLPAVFAGPGSNRGRFLAEARALARVRHPHVVGIHDVIDAEGSLAYAMDWIDGQSLKQLLPSLREPQGSGPLVAELGGQAPTQFAVRTGIAVARALQAVHDAQRIHRDVKPANILIRRDGHAFLADFGLVHDGESSLTASGGFLGTWAYAAPEQMRGGQAALDARCDIYSLGVTLYEAVAGRLPYDTANLGELAATVQAGNLVPLRRRCPHAPRDLETILSKATAVEANARYATAGEFADDLERLLRLELVRARPASLRQRVVRWTQRNRRALGVAMLAAAGAIPTTYWVMTSQQRARAEAHARAALCLRDARGCILQLGTHTRALTTWFGSRARAVAHASDLYAKATAGLPSSALHDVERRVLAAWANMDAHVDEFERGLADLRDLPHSTTALRAARGYERITTPAHTISDPDRWGLALVAFLTRQGDAVDACWGEHRHGGADGAFADAALGLAHMDQGQPVLAFARLWHARAEFAQCAPVALGLAEAATSAKNCSVAQAALQPLHDTAADLDQDTQWRLQLRQADLWAASGNRERAEQAYLALCGIPLELSRYARERLAVAYLERGWTADAVQIANQFGSGEVEHHWLLAQTAIAQGKLDDWFAHAAWALRMYRGVGRSPADVRRMLHILQLGGMVELCRLGVQRAALPPEQGANELGALPLTFPRPFTSSQAAAFAQWLLALCAGDAAAMEVAGRRAVECWFGAEDSAMSWLGSFASHLLISGSRTGAALARQAYLLALGAPFAASSLPAQVEVLATGEEAYGAFGDAIANVGDIDGGGKSELLVGAPGSSGGGWFGKAYLYRGEDRRLMHAFRPAHGLDFLGASVAGPGDLNGDGVPDVVIGAVSGSLYNGRVDAWSYSRRTQTWTRLWSWTGPEANARAEYVVAAGDVTGDGRPDVLIAAPRANNGFGTVRLVDGWLGREVRSWHGPAADSHFGVNGHMCAVPDLSGDGRPEIVISAYSHGGGRGTVFIYSGGEDNRLWRRIDGMAGESLGTRPQPVPDVDGDGVDDLLVGARTVGETRIYSLRTLTVVARWPGNPAEMSGTPAHVGDVNRDGVSDIAVGSHEAGAEREGRLQLFSGRVHTRQLLDLVGEHANEQLGAPNGLLAVPLGDWNDDGYDDFAVGNPWHGIGANDRRGRVLLVAGGPHGATVVGGASSCCPGPGSVLSVTHAPAPGSADFQVTCNRLPAGSNGFPLLALRQQTSRVGCIDFHLGHPAVFLPFVGPDARGVGTLPLPLPAAFVPGQLLIQFIIFDRDPNCGSIMNLRASNALRF